MTASNRHPSAAEPRTVVLIGRAAASRERMTTAPTRRGFNHPGCAGTLATPSPLIRIHPERIISWGLASHELGRLQARTVEAAP